jgi:hypothetical protein
MGVAHGRLWPEPALGALIPFVRYFISSRQVNPIQWMMKLALAPTHIVMAVDREERARVLVLCKPYNFYNLCFFLLFRNYTTN